MLEPYILILLAVVMSLSHAVIFRLTFDDGFEARFELYREAQKARMVEENEKFVHTMKGIIDLDPEAVEVMGFGEKWKQMLAGVDEMKAERGRLVNRIHVVYYFTFASVVFSGGGLVFTEGLGLPLGYTLYLTSFSWWLLVGGLLATLYLLLEYQLIERKFSRVHSSSDGRGTRIPPGGTAASAP
ncbi:hypothetical protein A3K69_04005 [Candidatus Bathyarchaeota archaeon RBG_16_57_9]|nr:MAG: hypothetical protein A3K69_04005 [Candidatus Bathyarchaeota archaeon RBG_16_57_9]